MSGPPYFAVQREDVPPCARCGGEPYLQVRLPHPRLPGWRAVALCPRCDAGDPSPAGQGLLALFAVDGQVDEGNLPAFVVLLRQWAGGLPAPAQVTADDLDEQIAAWRAGLYD